MSTERLQKLLASRGVASRRKAEELIVDGRVKVDGVIADLGMKVDPATAVVEVDGEPLAGARPPVYILLNKPRGFDTTVSDPHAERTVMELLEGVDRRVYPVGRLDRDTRGTLIFTDDGDLANKLLHPSGGVEKVYKVTVRGTLGRKELEKLASGVKLEEGMTRPAKISNVDGSSNSTRFKIAIKEGKKRQIRRMVREVGGHVTGLTRVSFGGITVDGLEEGRWRYLTKREVSELRNRVAEGVKGERGRTKGSRGRDRR